MSNKKPEDPSIEIKTGYVHTGTVIDMLNKRSNANAKPIGLITTSRISRPAQEMLISLGIAFAEIPESEMLSGEQSEKEN